MRETTPRRFKIWEVHYTGKEQIKQEYIDTDETKY